MKKIANSLVYSPESFGGILMQLRENAGIKKKGLELDFVEVALGMKPGSLGRIESGGVKSVPYRTVAHLSHLYGVDVTCGIRRSNRLDSQEDKALAHFKTILTEQERAIIVSQIEHMVNDHAEAQDFIVPCVYGESMYEDVP